MTAQALRYTQRKTVSHDPSQNQSDHIISDSYAYTPSHLHQHTSKYSHHILNPLLTTYPSTLLFTVPPAALNLPQT